MTRIGTNIAPIIAAIIAVNTLDNHNSELKYDVRMAINRPLAGEI